MAKLLVDVSEDDEQLEKRVITLIPLQTVAPANHRLGEFLDVEPVVWSLVPLSLPTTRQVLKNVNPWRRIQSIFPNVYSEVPGNVAVLFICRSGMR